MKSAGTGREKGVKTMPKIGDISVKLNISNSDEIMATAKRLSEISKELTIIGYRLQGKLEIKEKTASSCN